MQGVERYPYLLWDCWYLHLPLLRGGLSPVLIWFSLVTWTVSVNANSIPVSTDMQIA